MSVTAIPAWCAGLGQCCWRASRGCCGAAPARGRAASAGSSGSGRGWTLTPCTPKFNFKKICKCTDHIVIRSFTDKWTPKLVHDVFWTLWQLFYPLPFAFYCTVSSGKYRYRSTVRYEFLTTNKYQIKIINICNWQESWGSGRGWTLTPWKTKVKLFKNL